MQWLRRNPVAAFLPLQACLYFWNLGLLSCWTDEANTLMAVRGTLRGVGRLFRRAPLSAFWGVIAALILAIAAAAPLVAPRSRWAGAVRRAIATRAARVNEPAP